MVTISLLILSTIPGGIRSICSQFPKILPADQSNRNGPPTIIHQPQLMFPLFQNLLENSGVTVWYCRVEDSMFFTYFCQQLLFKSLFSDEGYSWGILMLGNFLFVHCGWVFFFNYFPALLYFFPLFYPHGYYFTWYFLAFLPFLSGADKFIYNSRHPIVF